MINLIASATSTPPNAVSTTELIAAMMYKLSPELINTLGSLGVERRFSTLENLPEFLCGEPMYATSSSTEMGVRAARRCIEEWGGDPRRVGLLIAATNTPAQLLPCLASEVMANMHGVLSRSISTVSMQAQGCSVLLKTVEVAHWYLIANPDKLALILLSEAHTPYLTPLLSEDYFGYREIARMRRGASSTTRRPSAGARTRPSWFRPCSSATARSRFWSGARKVWPSSGPSST